MFRLTHINRLVLLSALLLAALAGCSAGVAEPTPEDDELPSLLREGSRLLSENDAAARHSCSSAPWYLPQIRRMLIFCSEMLILRACVTQKLRSNSKRPLRSASMISTHYPTLG